MVLTRMFIQKNTEDRRIFIFRLLRSYMSGSRLGELWEADVSFPRRPNPARGKLLCELPPFPSPGFLRGKSFLRGWAWTWPKCRWAFFHVGHRLGWVTSELRSKFLES